MMAMGDDQEIEWEALLYGEGIEVLDDLAFILSFQSRVSLENSGSH
jgi:hypothetical protein